MTVEKYQMSTTMSKSFLSLAVLLTLCTARLTEDYRREQREQRGYKWPPPPEQ
jgi:hypothetical protein